MNSCLKALLFSMVLSSSCIASEQSCVPPRDAVCQYYSPGNVNHVGVLVKFKNLMPNQAVYLDGGCEMGVHKFTPLLPVNVINKYLHSKVTLTFTYCVGRRFVNKETVQVSSDSAIVCNVEDKIACNRAND